MTSALRYADERQGYTLSDETTFRRMQKQLELVPIVSEDARLLNTYSVVYSRSSVVGARFANWLTRGAGRVRLARYSIDDVRAFTIWPEACPADTPDAEPCRASKPE